jgi:hypothetical protein
MSDAPHRLYARQIEFVDQFLRAGSSANHMLLGPLGAGTGQVASGLIREVVERSGGPILIVAPPLLGRLLGQEAEDVGAGLNELSTVRLREVESQFARGPLERAVATVSPRVLSDSWTGHVLARVPWRLLVVEADSVGTTELDVLVSLMAYADARALILADTPAAGRRLARLGALQATEWATAPYEAD